MTRQVSTRKQPRASGQGATRRTQANAHCQQGRHTMSDTFRPGERVCLICGIVLYCPACLQHSNLSPITNGRAYTQLALG
jgi:hypothetical protein